MWVLLPVSGISNLLPVLVGVGAIVGFISGLFGVSGGFLLTPILMMIGIPPTVAAASDSCQIVAGSSSGTAAHFRLGNVDVKLGSILLLGAPTNTCTVSTEPNEFGPWEFGPLSLDPGAVLVFLNQAGASVSLSVVAT